MNAMIISRIVGAVVLGIIGAFTSLPIHEYVSGFIPNYSLSQKRHRCHQHCCFCVIRLSDHALYHLKPLQWLRRVFNKATPQTLVSGLVGLIIGLITAAIMAFPLSLLPKPIGQILPFVGVVLFA